MVLCCCSIVFVVFLLVLVSSVVSVVVLVYSCRYCVMIDTVLFFFECILSYIFFLIHRIRVSSKLAPLWHMYQFVVYVFGCLLCGAG